MDKYISKIRKLLKLSGSSNPHEAALALSRAQQMMKKYNLDSDSVLLSDYGAAQTRILVKNPPDWVCKLLIVIEKAFGVDSVITSELDARWRTHGAIMFIGLKSHCDLASYCFDVLYRQILNDRKVYIGTLHKNCKRSTKTTRADWYCLGWISEVRNKVIPFVVSEGHSNLIRVWKEKNLNLSSYQPRVVKEDKGQYDAYLNGKLDGANASLHAGMGRKFDQLGSR